MKSKIRLTETNLISLIKRVLLEQDDMDTPETLAQRQQQQQQPAQQQQQQQQQQQPLAAVQQPATQRQVACPNGYTQKNKGPYGKCDKAVAIQNLQKKFNITPDGKLGPTTLRYIKHFFQNDKKTQITDEEINSYIKQSTPDAVATTNTPYNPVGSLGNLNGKLIKISNSSYAIESIYASYRTQWKNGEFVIYINVVQGGLSGSKKYKFGTNCSLLNNSTINLVGDTTKYYFNEYNVTNTIKTHFCQKKSNQV